MNFELEDIKPEHFDEITSQSSQIYYKEVLEKNPKHKYLVCQHSIGKTGRLDGVIIGICGITQITSYMGEGWAYFADIMPKGSIKVIKEIRKFIQAQKHIRRIQCTVDIQNFNALKYARVLGFKPEGILKAYGPNGHDHVMFTIINRSLEWEAQ